MNEPTAHSVEPLPPPPSTAARIFFGTEGLRPGWGLLLFVLLFVSISIATRFTVNHVRHKPAGQTQRQASEQTPPDASQEKSAHLFLTEGASLLVVLLVTFLLARVERRPFRTYGLGGRHRLPQFLQGLLYGLLCLSLLVAALHFTGHLPFGARLLPPSEAIRYGFIWALGFALVAFLEETLLRGYLQYTLARGLTAIVQAISSTPKPEPWGFWTAALFLSFLFGLGHGSNPGESPIGLLSAALAGLVFCLALYRTGSLWWALGFHASWDWAQSFLYGVPDSGITIQHRLIATHPVGPPLLSGGLTGPEGSIFILPILALIAAIILLTLPSRYSALP